MVGVFLAEKEPRYLHFLKQDFTSARGARRSALPVLFTSTCVGVNGASQLARYAAGARAVEALCCLESSKKTSLAIHCVALLGLQHGTFSYIFFGFCWEGWKRNGRGIYVVLSLQLFGSLSVDSVIDSEYFFDSYSDFQWNHMFPSWTMGHAMVWDFRQEMVTLLGLVLKEYVAYDDWLGLIFVLSIYWCLIYIVMISPHQHTVTPVFFVLTYADWYGWGVRFDRQIVGQKCITHPLGEPRWAMKTLVVWVV